MYSHQLFSHGHKLFPPHVRTMITIPDLVQSMKQDIKWQMRSLALLFKFVSEDALLYDDRHIAIMIYIYI